MSSDQAARLRLLVTDDTSSEEVVTPRAGATLSVVGAKGGVGTSTVALNLAVALSMVGDRVELATHDDLEATERDLDAGPAGVAMRNAAAWQTFCSASRHRPPLPPFDELPDWLVVDAGRSSDNSLPITGSNQTLIVTTPEPASIMAAFAAVRLAGERGVTADLIINRAGAANTTAEATLRFRDATRRLLGYCVVIHELPEDPAVLDAARLGRPVVLARLACPFSRGIQRLVDHWTSAGGERAA